MTPSTDLKSQRDRYLAFALAAADVLIEARPDGTIATVTGASRAVLDNDAATLNGTVLADLFQPSETATLKRLLATALSSGRIEPAVLHLKRSGGPQLLANVGICHLPGGDHLHVSITALAEALRLAMPKRDDLTGLLAMCDFQHMAEKGISPTDAGSADAMLQEMRLVRMGGLSRAVKSLPGDRSRQLMADIGGVLRVNALDASSATQIGEDAFAVLAGPGDNAAAESRLRAELDQTLNAAGIAPGTVNSRVTTLSLDTGDIDETNVARALAYAISSFARDEGGVPLSLADSVRQSMASTVKTYETVRHVLTSGKFSLSYQPIVDLTSRDVHHYESLLRFPGDSEPYETVRVSEQLGLIQEIDDAVLRRVIDKLNATPHASIAVNISGLSAQSPRFQDSLTALLGANRALRDRLLLELTESADIENIEGTAAFLAGLRRRGFAVCLDDFGAGAAAYTYLRNFDVDFVKIDGVFLKSASSNVRDKALIRSVAGLANELGCRVIGEHIETEAMARMAAELGIGLGQGYLFGRPESDIPLPVQPVSARRMGERDTWA